MHFWSNFELADFSFFRSKKYQDYFEYLDRAGGFFYERWGDAPVHSLAVGIFLKPEQVHYFEGLFCNQLQILDIGTKVSKLALPFQKDVRTRVIVLHSTRTLETGPKSFSV